MLDAQAENNLLVFCGSSGALGRVYDNSRARDRLEWEPRYSFVNAIEMLLQGADYRSKLAQQTGSKGYHDTMFDEGPYPVSRFQGEAVTSY